MTSKLNIYGDAPNPTEAGCGMDVSSQRTDALDQASCDFIRARAAKGERVTALDLGGGYGAHAIRMAEAGAERVIMVDKSDMARARFAEAVSGGKVKDGVLAFVQKDFGALTDDDVPQGFQVLYSQRAIHYLPYDDAKSFLTFLFNRMTPGGGVFLSANGWDTEYGKTYPDRDKPVQQRFALVAPDMREKHGIHHPVVTYKAEELKTLLEEAGFREAKAEASAFGNIKATAKR